MLEKPFALTQKELKEIAAVKSLQDMWGAANAAEMEEFLESVYIARFDFVNESPGYVGDLFIIQPSFLDSDVVPTRLIRGENKQLVVLEEPQAVRADEMVHLE